MEHAEEVAGTLNRALELVVDRGEWEEVVVRSGLLLRELAEAGDEACLVEELAARRRGEEWVTSQVELGGDRVGPAAVGVGDDVVHVGVERRLDGRIGPLGLALPPAVVHIRPGLAQQDRLDPVGRRPPGRIAGADAQAPDRLGVALVRRRLGLEIIPGRRRRAGVVMQLGVEPDESLDRRLDEDPVGLPVDLSKLDEAGRRLTGVRLHVEHVVERLQRPGVRVLLHLAGAGEACQDGKHAGGDTGRQDVVDRPGALVLHLGAGLILPRLDHGEEVGLLDVGPGADHRHRRAVEVSASAPGWCAAGVIPARARGQDQNEPNQGCDESPTRSHVSS